MIYYLISEADVPIKELVKDVEWQKLRQSLVGTWKVTPEENCKKLRKYLGNDISKADLKRLRIVMNYLTGSGFRYGAIKHECISELRKEIGSEIKKRHSQSK